MNNYYISAVIYIWNGSGSIREDFRDDIIVPLQQFDTKTVEEVKNVFRRRNERDCASIKVVLDTIKLLDD